VDIVDPAIINIYLWIRFKIPGPDFLYVGQALSKTGGKIPGAKLLFPLNFLISFYWSIRDLFLTSGERRGSGVQTLGEGGHPFTHSRVARGGL